jgi:ribosomal protein S18 acetylase RimI-like enzyme
MKDVMEIRRAGENDVDALVPLFDAFRHFCSQEPDPERTRWFLTQCIAGQQSAFLVATNEGSMVGFVHLCSSLSSARLSRTFVVKDLFVESSSRGEGIAAELMHEAIEFARKAGAIRLSLTTDASNFAARSLYERLGWKKSEEICTYQVSL